MLHEWRDPPPMDIGAPEPALQLERQQLWLAYRTRRHDHFAVIRFTGVERVLLGPPSAERLSAHPLYPDGLAPYAFFEVLPASGSASAGRGLKQWVASFHDELLDVQATMAEVLVSAVESVDAAGALAAMRA